MKSLKSFIYYNNNMKLDIDYFLSPWVLIQHLCLRSHTFCLSPGCERLLYQTKSLSYLIVKRSINLTLMLLSKLKYPMICDSW